MATLEDIMLNIGATDGASNVFKMLDLMHKAWHLQLLMHLTVQTQDFKI